MGGPGNGFGGGARSKHTNREKKRKKKIMGGLWLKKKGKEKIRGKVGKKRGGGGLGENPRALSYFQSKGEEAPEKKKRIKGESQ